MSSSKTINTTEVQSKSNDTSSKNKVKDNLTESDSDNYHLMDSDYEDYEDEAIRCGKCYATHWWSNKQTVCRHCKTPLLWDVPPSSTNSPKASYSSDNVKMYK